MIDEKLIFDIGLHKGEDTEFYLKKGFKVVAFEANPELIADCSRRFSEDISEGRLVIIGGAIGDATSGDTITFYVNTKNSTWGTINPGWVDRNAQLGSPSLAITVNRIDMADAFRSHGIPFYMKVDIEGADRVAIQSLEPLDTKPRYVSLETDKEDFDRFREEIDMLSALGYRRFKPVQQSVVPGTTITTRDLKGRTFTYTFAEGASGAFGDDLPGPWLDYDQCIAAYRGIFRKYRLLGDGSPVNAIAKVGRAAEIMFGPAGWHDLHATV